MLLASTIYAWCDGACMMVLYLYMLCVCMVAGMGTAWLVRAVRGATPQMHCLQHRNARNPLSLWHGWLPG